MSVIVCSLQGRFGNQLMQYLFCRALAEQTGRQLRVDSWIGDRIFALADPHPNLSGDDKGNTFVDGKPLRRVTAAEALQAGWEINLEVRDYCQSQTAMIYTKRQAQSWLRFRPEIESGCQLAILNDRGDVPDVIAWHLRHGDFEGYGYPMVDRQSYQDACEQFGLDWRDPGKTVLSEEEPTPHAPFIPDDLSFVVDFYRMVKAPTLLRANSTFSWCAALLGDGLVLSPVIDGLEGGKKHRCKFVAGNHPRLANFDFTTELYVAP